MKARILSLSAALTLAATGAASAQQAVPTIPPGVQNNPIVQSILQGVNGILQTTNGPTATGTVTFFRRYDMQVQTAPNVYRTIHLHPGTVINPRGGTPSAGTRVDVSGRVQPDNSLDADQITIR